MISQKTWNEEGIEALTYYDYPLAKRVTDLNVSGGVLGPKQAVRLLEAARRAQHKPQPVLEACRLISAYIKKTENCHSSGRNDKLLRRLKKEVTELGKEVAHSKQSKTRSTDLQC